MNKEEIIKMAREAGLHLVGTEHNGAYTEVVESFAQLVAAAERELCIADIQMHIPRSGRDTLEYKMAMRMIERIRTRGQQ